MRDVLGSGKISSPDEWNAIVKDLKENGVEVKCREGIMAYAPDPREAGLPGQLLIDPDASLSALKHEYQHFLDAKAEGFPTMGDQLSNPKKRIIKELRAYLVEIKEADKLGLKEISQQLFENYRAERTEIIVRYLMKGGK